MFAILLLQLVVVCFNIATFQVSSTNESDPVHNNPCLLTWTLPPHGTKFGSIMCVCAGPGIEDQPICGLRLGPTLTSSVTIDSKFCMTFDEESNITYIGRCPYNSLKFYQSSGSIHLPQNALELNSFMCNVTNFTGHHYFCGQQRRRDLLCGKCEDGLGPAVMSYTHPCIKCRWYGWLLYLALSFIPATILCFLVILLRINVMSPPLNAVVLLSHVMASHVNQMPCTFFFSADKNHLATLCLYVITFYGFFNMDFLIYVVPPFCISNTMSTLTVIALDYAVALYPLLLSAMIYLLIEVHDRGCWLFVCVWRPLHRYLVRFRKSWDIKGSIINSFATLYVLSFTKVISTSVRLMLTTITVDIWGEQKFINLYYNASCSFFQKCHRPYAILTLTVTIVVIIIPSLFIFLHPCKIFHKYRCFQCHRLRLANEIAKIFHHSFKDGINETLDCRWFAGIYLLLRIVIASAANWRTTQQIQIICSVTGLILVAIFQPHTRAAFNYIDSFLFGGLAIIFILLPAGQRNHIAQVLLFLAPILTIIVLVCWKLRKKIGGKTASGLYRCLQKLCTIKISMCTHRSSTESTSSVITQDREALVNKTNQSVLYAFEDFED